VKSTDIGETSDGYHTFNELYEHRHALFLALLSCNAGVLPTWMSIRHDDGASLQGWFVAGIRLPNGMITYHLPDRLWEACKTTRAEVLEHAPKWDGHTSADVVKRLMEFARA
jgi:hypothetical protein